ncbi:PaaX family transcriptional regulator C-terminal domain-containing protein [Streptomyces sp. Li-HN-5-11]|uniref:PaaX family transcriptional regulator n=1 Tax=Streptomyces sp. Li-HN-5-11 TaxID=3075432 RepID=UPI0028A8DAE4|nr:PaaX family transcriptional regulator C-terminal domain-containing protein [Streptomyces sp. Li-HN-5-11]WNM33626.1 PaaX family transcriptional regulator C-terminal domain-containing protein [Streptomyces sp. Li-HN-5-11]
MTSFDQAGAAARPQSLMLTFFGVHVLGRDIALSAGSLIDVLARAGITEEAVRSTLTRMVRRELLTRYRRGRKTYFGLTERAAAVLQDGHDRIWHTGAVNRDWDGTWTLVGFSLPEAWRRERHDLRSRLVWGGFGPLQNGLWVAPGTVDVAAVVGGLGLQDHLRVFHSAMAGAPTDARTVLETAFDIHAIAKGYEEFLARWGGSGTGAGDNSSDVVVRQLLLHSDWLDLVRRDPHLPASHLPHDWPAERAEELFHELAQRCEEPARQEAARVLDTLTGIVPADGTPVEDA